MPGEHRADDVGQRRREAEPAEDPLQLGRLAAPCGRPMRWIAIRPMFAPAPASDRGDAQASTKLAAGDEASQRPRRGRRRPSGRPRRGSAGGSRAGRRAGRRPARATIGAAANRPSRMPTAQAAWPSRSAASGAAMRMPAMHECSAIWPPISASSARDRPAGRRVTRSASSSASAGSIVERSGQQRLARAAPAAASTPCAALRAIARVRTSASLDRVAIASLQLLARVREHVAELAELGLDRAQHLPHLGRALSRARACESPSAGWSASPAAWSARRA